jgi:hypothetical protein
MRVFGKELVRGETTGAKETDYPEGAEGGCKVEDEAFSCGTGEAIGVVYWAWLKSPW